jgi:hypothetical protein
MLLNCNYLFLNLTDHEAKLISLIFFMKANKLFYSQTANKT